MADFRVIGTEPMVMTSHWTRSKKSNHPGRFGRSAAEGCDVASSDQFFSNITPVGQGGDLL
jgi:hypothetical protein